VSADEGFTWTLSSLKLAPRNREPLQANSSKVESLVATWVEETQEYCPLVVSVALVILGISVPFQYAFKKLRGGGGSAGGDLGRRRCILIT
jgi:hypothetical protein